MSTNCCGLMIILTHLNLCHQYILNSGQWMDNMYKSCLQVVISLLYILSHYDIEISIPSYFLLCYIISDE